MTILAIRTLVLAERRSAMVGQRTRIWARHLLEMLVAMYVGMVLLGPQIAGIAAAAGYADLAVQHTDAATLLMALEMALPMAIWMDHRGHARRAIAEMSAAMLLPAPIVVATVQGDPMGVYHAASLLAMLALMVYRLGEYSAHHGAV